MTQYYFVHRFLRNIIEGKRGRGKPRRSYFDPIKEKVDVDSYQEPKVKQRWFPILHRHLALKLKKEEYIFNFKKGNLDCLTPCFRTWGPRTTGGQFDC